MVINKHLHVYMYMALQIYVQDKESQQNVYNIYYNMSPTKYFYKIIKSNDWQVLIISPLITSNNTCPTYFLSSSPLTAYSGMDLQ